MQASIPAAIRAALLLADPSWEPVLIKGLEAVTAADSHYLTALASELYLPTENRLFAAFSQPIERVRYVLVGEGPYPRAESATGVCFMDGVVGSLWSDNGLSKQVNRATSLRNFIKMLLVADGQLSVTQTGGAALSPIAENAVKADSSFVPTLAELQQNMIRQGFLLLNAALVFRPDVAPVKEARAWRPFLQTVFAALASREPRPTLVLWGKIAEQLQALPQLEIFTQVVSEHPYNLSFIGNVGMHGLFAKMHLLTKTSKQLTK